MADILIKNITIMETEPPFSVTENADVVITGSVIEKAGVNASEGVQAGKVIDGTGKILIPGNVCAHHHYYSGLSRGMLISAGPQTAAEALASGRFFASRIVERDPCARHVGVGFHNREP